MEIVAITKGGVLIQATNEEVREIIHSVSGTDVKELNIGQKIPAIDYAGSITKVKAYKETYAFKNLCESTARVHHEIISLKNALESAASVNI